MHLKAINGSVVCRQLYHKLCTIVARGGTLVPFDRGLAIQLLPEHDPGLLALPFLALAPRSLEQATQVLMNELHKLTPSLCSIFSQRCKMVVVDPASLIIYLKNYDSACELVLCGCDPVLHSS